MDAAVPGLLPSPVNLQIIYDDVAFAMKPEINEWVRHKHPHGVKHICVVVTISDNEQVLAVHGSENGDSKPGGDFCLLLVIHRRGRRRNIEEPARRSRTKEVIQTRI